MKTALCHILFIFSLFLSTASSAQDTKSEITLITGEWPPYTGQGLNNYGFLSEIVAATFAQMKQPIQYKWLPWVRGASLVKKGEYIATYPYAKTILREEAFYFSDPIFFTRTEFFYNTARSAKIIYNNLQDLKELRVGVVRGHGSVELLTREQLNLTIVNNSKQLVKMLKRNRVDIIAINKRTGWNIIKNNYPDDISKFATLSKPANKSHGVHLMLSKTHPESLILKDQFNKALKTIKNNGLYNSILHDSLPARVIIQ